MSFRYNNRSHSIARILSLLACALLLMAAGPTQEITPNQAAKIVINALRSSGYKNVPPLEFLQVTLYRTPENICLDYLYEDQVKRIKKILEGHEYYSVIDKKSKVALSSPLCVMIIKKTGEIVTYKWYSEHNPPDLIPGKQYLNSWEK